MVVSLVWRLRPPPGWCRRIWGRKMQVRVEQGSASPTIACHPTNKMPFAGDTIGALRVAPAIGGGLGRTDNGSANAGALRSAQADDLYRGSDARASRVGDRAAFGEFWA